MAGILGRSQPIRPHLARPIVTPVGASVLTTRPKIISQAVQRSYIRPNGPRPHLAPPIIGPAVKLTTTPTIISQARQRAMIRPNLIRPHLARPIVIPAPVFIAPRPKLTLQAIQRSYVRPNLIRPHLPIFPVPASTGDPFILGTVILVSLDTPYRFARLPIRPHLAKPVLSTPPNPLPPGTYIRQSIKAKFSPQFRPHLARPVIPFPSAPPVARGTFINQSIKVRFAPQFRPHLPKPVLPLVIQADPQLLQFQVNQALRAAERFFFYRNFRPHLAPPVIPFTTPPPVSRGTFIFQSNKSYYRRIIRPHLAPPVLIPPTTFIAPRAKITSQAIFRSHLRPNLIRPHLPPRTLRVANPPLPRGRFTFQAIARSYYTRGIKRKFPFYPLRNIAAGDPTLRRPFRALYSPYQTSAEYTDLQTSAIYTLVTVSRAVYSSDSYLEPGADMAILSIKQNDLSPSIAATLYQGSTVIDLTGCTVKLKTRSRKTQVVKIDTAATVVTPTSGTVRYDLVAGDTDTVDDYEMEWEITLPSTKKVTVPNDSYDILSVKDDIS